MEKQTRMIVNATAVGYLYCYWNVRSKIQNWRFGKSVRQNCSCSSRPRMCSLSDRWNRCQGHFTVDML